MNEIILIIVLQLLYVPLLTLRTIFLVKNMSLLAAIIGIIEMLMYVFGLALVFNGDQGMLAMVVYAVGFGIGILLGTKIEERLAIGYVYITIYTVARNEELLTAIRNAGFATTTFVGEGRDGKRHKYDILALRKQEKELFTLINKYEPSAFIISYEPKSFQGGFVVKRLDSKKRKLKQREK